MILPLHASDTFYHDFAHLIPYTCAHSQIVACNAIYIQWELQSMGAAYGESFKGAKPTR